MKVTMGIIDKCGVRGDATLCVVIFLIGESQIQCLLTALCVNLST